MQKTLQTRITLARLLPRGRVGILIVGLVAPVPRVLAEAESSTRQRAAPQQLGEATTPHQNLTAGAASRSAGEALLSTNEQSGETSRVLLLKAVAEADQIPGERARAAAQWQLVQPLVELGLGDLAFQQAMKLRTSNPQTCIYSLSTIALNAQKRGDNNEVDRAWNAAIDANKNAGKRHDHYVIELGFKLDRPLDDAIAIATAAVPDGKQRAFCDIRNELAARGRIDEAYKIASVYLPVIPKTIHDREIAYRCASAKQLVEKAAHDHFGQAIRILHQMPNGEHRDFVIVSLIDNLLDVTNNEPVSNDRMALAEKWVQEIHEELKRAAALRTIMRHRLPRLGAAELEQKLTEVASREEKEELLSRIFRALLDAGRLEDADAMLPRRVQLIMDQPRPDFRGKFGFFSDDDAVRVARWMHEKEMVTALIKAGRKDAAQARVEAMKNLPEAPPTMFLGNLESIRLSHYLELEDYDSVEKLIAEGKDPGRRAGGMAALSARFIAKGQRERGLKGLQSILKMSSEELFPASTESLYFAAEPYRQLAVTLVKDGRMDEALRVLSKVPEHEQTAHVFEAFGELVVQTGQLKNLDVLLARLPHHAARTGTCLGAFRELSKANERE